MLVSLTTLAFAPLVDRLGLVVTMIVSLTLAALRTPDTRWREYSYARSSCLREEMVAHLREDAARSVELIKATDMKRG
jgi:hypothetical protein